MGPSASTRIKAVAGDDGDGSGGDRSGSDGSGGGGGTAVIGRQVSRKVDEYAEIKEEDLVADPE